MKLLSIKSCGRPYAALCLRRKMVLTATNDYKTTTDRALGRQIQPEGIVLVFRCELCTIHIMFSRTRLMICWVHVVPDLT